MKRISTLELLKPYKIPHLKHGEQFKGFYMFIKRKKVNETKDSLEKPTGLFESIFLFPVMTAKETELTIYPERLGTDFKV